MGRFINTPLYQHIKTEKLSFILEFCIAAGLYCKSNQAHNLVSNDFSFRLFDVPKGIRAVLYLRKAPLSTSQPKVNLRFPDHVHGLGAYHLNSFRIISQPSDGDGGPMLGITLI